MYLKHFVFLASILPAVVAGVIPCADAAGNNGSVGVNIQDIKRMYMTSLPPDTYPRS
ncbi:hypothetical protein PM082_006707 [Marasmius tenuissimus]|nr:hypothetical protein PM082_006707 [Marasmius tenuissimus]